jgi:hypothetical protein
LRWSRRATCSTCHGAAGRHVTSGAPLGALRGRPLLHSLWRIGPSRRPPGPPAKATRRRAASRAATRAPQGHHWKTKRNEMESIGTNPFIYSFLSVCSRFFTTQFGVPFLHPIPRGRRAPQLRTMPECDIRMLRKATLRTRRLRQNDQERSARNAARPEGQAALPHVSNLPERFSYPSSGFG